MRFLLHLDEVDILMGFAMDLLHPLWHEIGQVHNRTGTPLFCSGRTLLLYPIWERNGGPPMTPKSP